MLELETVRKEAVVAHLTYYCSTLLKIPRTTTKRFVQCLKLDTKTEKREFISLRGRKFLGDNTRARKINTMYIPDSVYFHSRSSIPMMTMTTMVMMMMMMTTTMMMMMIKNNNSRRKPANEIISNDSASFLLVKL